MKIRKGFVSNSSSSSFIIAAKKHPKIKIELEFDSYDEEYTDYETFVKDSCENWCCKDEKELREEGDWMRKRLDDAKDALDRGLTLYKGTTSSDDCDMPASMVLYDTQLPKSEKYEIIQDNEN